MHHDNLTHPQATNQLSPIEKYPNFFSKKKKKKILTYELSCMVVHMFFELINNKGILKFGERAQAQVPNLFRRPQNSYCPFHQNYSKWYIKMIVANVKSSNSLIYLDFFFIHTSMTYLFGFFFYSHKYDLYL